jgi:hypothetical protein
MPKFKTEVTTTDIARIGDRVVRVFAAVPCPRCLRGRLHATAMREVGEYQYAWTCQRCHSDVVAISAD